MTPSIQIVNSTLEDLATIFEFYDHAVAHQKKVSDKHWKGFDPELITQEIAESRQYKILVDGEVGCVFVVTFNDFNAYGYRPCYQNIFCLWKNGRVNKKLRPLNVILFVERVEKHRHGFCCRRGFIQQRCIGKWQPRQVAQHGLKVQQTFQAPL